MAKAESTTEGEHMNGTVLATQRSIAESFLPPRHSEYPPVYSNDQQTEITVIAGGLSDCQRHPLHARATQIQLSPQTQTLTIRSLHRNAKGVAFNLTKRERVSAFWFGVLFAALSFAAAIL